MMDNTCAILPPRLTESADQYYQKSYDICYWSYECSNIEENIMEFVEKARKYNYTEEQALAILVFNEFNFLKADCDLKVYRPLKGLTKINVKRVVKMISEGIIKNLKSREHRDFEEIIYMFPGYSTGDLLEFYGRNRLKIKKQTQRAKKYLRKSSQPIQKLPQLPTNGNNLTQKSDWSNCQDTQFRLVYSRQYDWIMDPNKIMDEEIDEWNGIDWQNILTNTDSQFINLLKRTNKKRDSRKRSNGCSIFDIDQLDYIIDREMTGLSSNSNNDKHQCTKDKLLQYIKSNKNICNGNFSMEEQYNTQEICQNLYMEHEEILGQYRSIVPKPAAFQKLSHQWSNLDFALLLLGLSRFGLDFCKISDILLTKSETMVRSFYFNYRQQFDLDRIIINSTPQVILDQQLPPHQNFHQSVNMLSVNTTEISEDSILKVEKNKYIPSPMCPSGSESDHNLPENDNTDECQVPIKTRSKTTCKSNSETKKSNRKNNNKEQSVPLSRTSRNTRNQQKSALVSIKQEPETTEEEKEEKSESEDEVPNTRVLRDRKVTNERFKNILDAERKAKNRKNYPRRQLKRKQDDENAEEGQKHSKCSRR